MVPFERSSLFLPNLSSKDFMTKNSKKATRWKYLQCIQYRYTGLWNVLSYVYFFKQANNRQRMKCFSQAGALCMYTLTEFLPWLWVACYPILQMWKLRSSYLSEIKQLMSQSCLCGQWHSKRKEAGGKRNATSSQRHAGEALRHILSLKSKTI